MYALAPSRSFHEFARSGSQSRGVSIVHSLCHYVPSLKDRCSASIRSDIEGFNAVPASDSTEGFEAVSCAVQMPVGSPPAARETLLSIEADGVETGSVSCETSNAETLERRPTDGVPDPISEYDAEVSSDSLTHVEGAGYAEIDALALMSAPLAEMDCAELLLHRPSL